VDLPASVFSLLVKVVWVSADGTGVCAGFILETSPFIFLIKAAVSIQYKIAIRIATNIKAQMSSALASGRGRTGPMLMLTLQKPLDEMVAESLQKTA
jgi:hypothetical protein